MKHTLFGSLLMAAAGFGSTNALAQSERIARPLVLRMIEADPPVSRRPPASKQRPSIDGIIHWNTPNKDGNLGGPGAGGGGGGGG